MAALALATSLLTAIAARADYTLDFEDGTKGTYAAADRTLNGVSWNLAEMVIGTTTNDKKNGLKAGKFQHDTNANALVALTMNAPRTNGIGTVTLLYARYGTEVNTPTLALEWAPGLTTNWTQAGSAFSSSGVDQLTNFTATINQPGSVRIRIRSVSGTTAGTNDKHVNVDDITMTDYVVPNQPPALNAPADISGAESNALEFLVSAGDPDGTDDVTLWATGVPSGAIFAPTTATAVVSNVFVWTSASPTGTYAVTFYAADKDGTNSQVTTVNVEGFVGPAYELIISEYGEGSSYNKYIEILNATGEDVDLAPYSLRRNTSSTNTFQYSLALSGTLAHNRTYVVVNNRANPALLAKANLVTSSLAVGFAGNGAVALFKNEAPLDLLGFVGTNANWGDNVTLIRKPSVVAPVAVYDTNQWDELPQDSWTNVGFHTMDGLPPQTGFPPVLNPVAAKVATLGQTVQFDVTAADPVDGDVITLSATELPAGATFPTVTNAASVTGTFNWVGVSPSGVHTSRFTAVDADGTNTLAVTITVTPPIISNQSVVVHFNEIRFDDLGTDDAEFIELVAPAGTNLESCVLVHHNGTAGLTPIWTFTFPSTVVPDDGILDTNGAALGFIVIALTNSAVTNTDFLLSGAMQNGPDGLVLYDPASNVLDAVAWSPSGTNDLGDLLSADPGPFFITRDGDPNAPNYLHVLPVFAASDDSVQAPNNIRGDTGENWVKDLATPGAINLGQTSGALELEALPPSLPTGALLLVR